MEKIIVTCALPYANGSLHLGHILEHIQADIWVRYQRMINNEVWFICADDAHGTPIMLKAKKIKSTPEQLIKKIYKEHKTDFKNFNIIHDNYHSTHSSENKKILVKIYNILKKRKLIKKKKTLQFYDIKEKMFLPDRLVIGTCPKCKTKNQYSDNCEICGSTYSYKEIINPKSTISNSIPILKNSIHYFFNLPKFTKMLKNWIASGTLNKNVSNKIIEWFKIGLKKWNISRDAPYFGFKIPKTNKYFYVWLDATIGYISTFKNLCNKKKKINFNEFWNKNTKTKLYHFIGKDIIYFHSLFWIAILEGCKLRKPNKIFIHGHLTINKIKMSKSKKTYIKAKTWLKYFNSDSLRYYFASKLSHKLEDIDLNLIDFKKKINNDIVNKLVNLAYRNLSFINKLYNNKLSKKLDNYDLYKTFVKKSKNILKYFNNCNFSQIIKKIMELTKNANYYIDQKSPWKLIKISKNKNKIHEICTTGINLFKILMTLLKPILPKLSNKIEKLLNTNLILKNIDKPLLNHKIKKPKKLFNRIKKPQIKNLLKK
ncbi:methionine--tRNA ligase [Candidatus Purcelliella pentastirinorum]|uniref:methionine--tRNA ligase n=1 Tax=Candidatus Purcelliella pentastirinorum TaxID=472834 RepID=UPI002367D64C|nr:methionine--tRNA ligase [Candidatus Purcelliella pentastirinorum]WDI78886.1 methionine--tRNA ligase [Candidatus Purcelliella pentastirinorum]WDR80020.1 methionine--tRNA ligase [Candidatus Purcelliella pentastirinorum]